MLQLPDMEESVPLLAGFMQRSAVLGRALPHFGI